MELKDGICARRTQKAGREKLRRDRVNEQFVELGNVVGNDTTLLCCLMPLNYHPITPVIIRVLAVNISLDSYIIAEA